jgi:hypothetical protein
MTMEEKVSRPDGSFFIPDFVEIQKKFFQFVEAGIIKGDSIVLEPIEVKEILFHPTRSFSPLPTARLESDSPRKTYESKLYVPATMVSKGLRRLNGCYWEYSS